MTVWRKYGGFNIKGWPSMRAFKVMADLRVIKHHVDVFSTQEFRWPWYWTTLASVFPRDLRNKWRSYPRARDGVKAPTRSAQAIVWKGSIFKRRGSQEMLLHSGAAGVSEDRWLRAALLQDRSNQLKCWFGTTHFVVGGDGLGDGPRRKAILAQDLRRLATFLDLLKGTGWPIIFELDANIHVGTVAYARLRQIVEARGGKFYGTLGVEYLFVINGTEAKVSVREPWIIPTSKLNTDHEGRCLTFRLMESA